MQTHGLVGDRAVQRWQTAAEGGSPARELRSVRGVTRYPCIVLQVLAVWHTLISLALVGLILMHSGRDAGLGGMGFTPASQGGTHIVERNLTRLTLVVAAIFTVDTVLLFRMLS